MKLRNTCLAAGILVGFIAGAAKADVFWGATASGNAKQFEITCGTCPNPVTLLSNLSDGGFLNTSAGVEFSQGTLVSYFATAILTGPESLPRLGAQASGDIAVVSPNTFFYAAGADARGTQLYTYTGSTPTDYTIEYDVDGLMAGGILTQISGGFAVFGSGFNPNQEVQPTLGFSFDHVNGDGTEKPVHLTGSVTFSVNPGDSFYVRATLDVFVDSRSQSMFASADAAHTLAMGFTQGDPSLLVPAATDPGTGVPEPSGGLLTGIGAVCVAIGARRRRSRVRG